MIKWRSNPTAATKKNSKQKVILRAKEVFGLSDEETEALANKAGLSLSYVRQPNIVTIPREIITPSKKPTEFGTELCPIDVLAAQRANANEENCYNDFIRIFNGFISAFPGKMTELYEAAAVSERMFFHIKLGKHMRKEPITALLIVMNKTVACIQKCLQMAGFILSNSLPGDIVVMWMIENGLYEHKGTSPVYRVNEVLHMLGLPLLMTKTG